jgi:ubiquinone/menaquinone biosynthesis C-methylase UbiE
MIELGLPLEYGKFSQYFDANNFAEDTEVNNALIEKLLREHSVQTVLDLTCGTGSQVFYLINHGYECTGADVSPMLLEIAREKATTKNLNIDFIDGDMRTLKVKKFDAVITIFNAIGHLIKGDFMKAIQNVRENLNDGGIYIFDILNLEAMTDEVVANLAYFKHKKIASTQLLSTQCSIIDRKNGILTSYDNYMIQKNAEKPERFYNEFSLQIYTKRELQEILSENGFEVIEQCGMDGQEFLHEKSLSILTVAQKQSI